MTSLDRYVKRMQKIQDRGDVVHYYDVHHGYQGYSLQKIEVHKLDGKMIEVFFDLQGNWLPKYKKVEENIDNE